MGLGDMLQAERDAEDAKRYRWLRDRVRAVYDAGGEPVQLVFPQRAAPKLEGWRKRVDAAIDADMREWAKWSDEAKEPAVPTSEGSKP